MSEPDLSRAEFRAAFPNIMSAILFGADGVRLKLDIPEMDRAEAIKLTQWQGRVLKVTIEPEPNEDEDDGRQQKHRRIHI